MSINQIFEELFARYPILIPCRDDIYNAYELMIKCYSSGGKVMICGNGGSAADSEHIAGELLKGFNLKRPLDVEIHSQDCDELLEELTPFAV